MNLRWLGIVVGLGTALLGTAAMAQQVEIQAQKPAPREKQPDILAPGLHYETTRPTDADYYPQTPRVRHDPAFIEGASQKVETPNGSGRVGLSGWTAPNTPVGSPLAYRETTGWFAVGLSVTWNGPPPPRKPPAR
jgi:hypothetical protein